MRRHRSGSTSARCLLRLAPADEEDEDRERASSSRCMFCEVVVDGAVLVAATPVAAARRSVGAREARRDIIVNSITGVIIYLCTEDQASVM